MIVLNNTMTGGGNAYKITMDDIDLKRYLSIFYKTFKITDIDFKQNDKNTIYYEKLNIWEQHKNTNLSVPMKTLISVVRDRFFKNFKYVIERDYKGWPGTSNEISTSHNKIYASDEPSNAGINMLLATESYINAIYNLDVEHRKVYRGESITKTMDKNLWTTDTINKSLVKCKLPTRNDVKHNITIQIPIRCFDLNRKNNLYYIAFLYKIKSLPLFGQDYIKLHNIFRQESKNLNEIIKINGYCHAYNRNWNRNWATDWETAPLFKNNLGFCTFLSKTPDEINSNMEKTRELLRNLKALVLEMGNLINHSNAVNENIKMLLLDVYNYKSNGGWMCSRYVEQPNLIKTVINNYNSTLATFLITAKKVDDLYKNTYETEFFKIYESMIYTAFETNGVYKTNFFITHEPLLWTEITHGNTKDYYCNYSYIDTKDIDTIINNLPKDDPRSVMFVINTKGRPSGENFKINSGYILLNNYYDDYCIRLQEYFKDIAHLRSEITRVVNFIPNLNNLKNILFNEIIRPINSEDVSLYINVLNHILFNYEKRTQDLDKIYNLDKKHAEKYSTDGLNNILRKTNRDNQSIMPFFTPDHFQPKNSPINNLK